MKKIIFLLFGLWSVTFLNAQTPDIISLGASAITGNSLIISARAYAPTGMPVRAILQFWPNSGTQSSTDSSNWNGQGTSPINIQFPKSGLSLSTTYSFRLLFRHQSTNVLLDSTSIESVTTAATNSIATVQILSITPLISSLKVITKVNNANQSGIFRLFYKTNDGNPNWSNTAGKSFTASYSDQYDTTIITGLTTVQYILQGEYVPGAGSVTSGGYAYSTPLTGTTPTVYGTPTVNYRYDTMQVVTYTNQSGGSNDSAMVRIYDSTNTVVFSRKMRVNDQFTTGVFTNYFNTINYGFMKLFTVEQVVWNNYGRDSVKTVQYRMLTVPATVQAIVGTPTIKANSVSLSIRMTKDVSSCSHRHGYKIAKKPFTDWTVRSVITYSANTATRDIVETGLDPNSEYRITSLDTNCTDAVSELVYNFTTLAPLAAPTISTLTADAGCASSILKPFSIDVQKGDTPLIEIGMITAPKTIPNFTDSFRLYNGSYNYNGDTANIAHNTTVTWVVRVTSKEGDKKTYVSNTVTSFPLNPPTPNRAEVAKTDKSITIEIFGGTGCGAYVDYIIKVRERDPWNLITTRKGRIFKIPGTSQYKLDSIVFDNLSPNTWYDFEVGVANKDNEIPETYPTNLQILTKSAGSTSSVSNLTDNDIWTTNPEVIVHDVMGRSITTARYNDLRSQLPKNQMFTVWTSDKKAHTKIIFDF